MTNVVALADFKQKRAEQREANKPNSSVWIFNKGDRIGIKQFPKLCKDLDEAEVVKHYFNNIDECDVVVTLEDAMWLSRMLWYEVTGEDGHLQQGDAGLRFELEDGEPKFLGEWEDDK